jgi:hypothetical protein
MQSSGALPRKRRRIASLVLATIFAAVFVQTASAASYWFYQGYLPRPINGDRFVLLGSEPPWPIYQRESWAACTHNMKYIQIDNSGNWDGGTFSYSTGCDHEIMVQYPDLHTNYGCENPAGLSQVYVNCRAGTNP